MNRIAVGGIAVLLLVGPAAFAAAPTASSSATPAGVALPAVIGPNDGAEPPPEGEFPPDLVADDGPIGKEISEDGENDLETLFHEHLLADKSKEADAVLRSALATAAKPLPVHLARMMMAMGNQYAEEGVIASAQFWLDRAVREGGSHQADEESGKTIASLIQPRLAWLKSGGQRPWCDPDPKQLAEKLSAAVIKNDRAALTKMLTQVEPYVGEWQSEWEPCQVAELLDFLGKHWKAGITWAPPAREAFQKALAAKEKVLYINTSGWVNLENHKNIQFALQKVPQGWEWRGIVLGE